MTIYVTEKNFWIKYSSFMLGHKMQMLACGTPSRTRPTNDSANKNCVIGSEVNFG